MSTSDQRRIHLAMGVAHAELSRLHKEMASLLAGGKPQPSTETADSAPWLTLARREAARGVREVPGSRDNASIVAYHAHTRGGGAPDETAWCASFVGWCLHESGYLSTRSKSARSYEHYGRELDAPMAGCIVVLSRGSNPRHGHVGFYVGAEEDGALSAVRILGGNQSDAVNVKPYPLSRVVAYRWPVKE